MSAFNTKHTADISVFYDNDVQSILALFLTKPALYKDYTNVRDRQGYFFDRFRRFAGDYYHFSGDESVYFASTRKEVAGEANICGGAGKMSGASSRYFKNKYHQIEESRNAQIDQFSKKYGVTFGNGTDSRLFVGVSEIWNKLDNASTIVAESKWANVVANSYDDETFTKPIPLTLEKTLVPFAIRNRAIQKRRNMKSSSSIIRAHPNQEDEEEQDEEETNQKETQTTESGPKILLVLPEIDDDEW
jgi:mRNA deadenylase 3'-5' endonuclease subunit Ccr4